MKLNNSKGSNEFVPFSLTEFCSFVLDNKVVGFYETPIVLKSGRSSHWYVNWRTIAEDVWLLDKLADYVISFAYTLKQQSVLEELPDSFYGVPEGATKIALVTQYKWASRSKNFGPGSHSMAMGRGKVKEHGALKDRAFLGVPLGKTIVIEDVTTTGSSMIDCVSTLFEAKVNVIAAFGLTNRMEKREDGKSIEEALKELTGTHVPYFHLSGAVDLLPDAAKRQNPNTRILKATEEEFAEFGIKPLRLI